MGSEGEAKTARSPSGVVSSDPCTTGTVTDGSTSSACPDGHRSKEAPPSLDRAKMRPEALLDAFLDDSTSVPSASSAIAVSSGIGPESGSEIRVAPIRQDRPPSSDTTSTSVALPSADVSAAATRRPAEGPTVSSTPWPGPGRNRSMTDCGTCGVVPRPNGSGGLQLAPSSLERLILRPLPSRQWWMISTSPAVGPVAGANSTGSEGMQPTPSVSTGATSAFAPQVRPPSVDRRDTRECGSLSSGESVRCSAATTMAPVGVVAAPGMR